MRRSPEGVRSIPNAAAPTASLVYSVVSPQPALRSMMPILWPLMSYATSTSLPGEGPASRTTPLVASVPGVSADAAVFFVSAAFASVALASAGTVVAGVVAAVVDGAGAVFCFSSGFGAFAASESALRSSFDLPRASAAASGLG